MVGTFSTFSWDIMEPISYLMMYGNFNLSFLFYLGIKRDLLATNIHEILKTRFAHSAAWHQGIDLEELDKLKAEATKLKALLEKASN